MMSVLNDDDDDEDKTHKKRTETYIPQLNSPYSLDLSINVKDPSFAAKTKNHHHLRHIMLFCLTVRDVFHKKKEKRKKLKFF